MTPEDNETTENQAEIKESQKPWRWGDEMEDSKKKLKKKPELEGNNSTFTSIAELLDAERDIELKRLGKYFKKSSRNKKSK